MNNGALTHCKVNKKEQNIQTQQQICFMVVYVSGGGFYLFSPRLTITTHIALLLGYPLAVLHGILVVRIGEGVGECPTELTVCLIFIVCRIH